MSCSISHCIFQKLIVTVFYRSHWNWPWLHQLWRQGLIDDMQSDDALEVGIVSHHLPLRSVLPQQSQHQHLPLHVHHHHCKHPLQSHRRHSYCSNLVGFSPIICGGSNNFFLSAKFGMDIIQCTAQHIKSVWPFNLPAIKRHRAPLQ